MKRNLIVGPAYPYRGGIADFNEALCKAFNQAGTHSEIVSFTLQYPSILFPGSSQYDYSDKPDLAIHRIISSINPLSWIRAARFIRKYEPDYLVVRYWLPFMAPALGSVLRLALRGKKIKVIAITDNIIPHEKRPFDKQLSAFFTSACDGFVAMSRSVMKELSQFPGTEKRIFLPHPVYDIFGEKVSKTQAQHELSLDRKFRYMLFFGFIRNYKGLDILLEALAQLQIPDVKLIIAGEFYEDSEKYQALIEKNDLKDRVILHTDFIPTDRVKYYFCSADIIVQPYRSATQSGVTQIAYNFGRPMLVTEVGGLPEIVPHGEAGYVVKPDPAAVAEALKDFFQNDREKLYSENVERLKEKFSWPYFVKGIEELVQAL